MNYKLSRRAKADIKEIYKHTVQHFGETQAELYLGGLDYSFELLMDNPKLGRLFERNIHRYIYRSHFIYYKIINETIFILQIENTRRNAPLQKDQANHRKWDKH